MFVSVVVTCCFIVTVTLLLLGHFIDSVGRRLRYFAWRRFPKEKMLYSNYLFSRLINDEATRSVGNGGCLKFFVTNFYKSFVLCDDDICSSISASEATLKLTFLEGAAYGSKLMVPPSFFHNRLCLSWFSRTLSCPASS